MVGLAVNTGVLAIEVTAVSAVDTFPLGGT
jgi:hypothetical protein